jgi:hypothetical protein
MAHGPGAPAALPVRLGYVVLAHRAPAQVARLVRRLQPAATGVAVHLDRRAPRAVARELRARLGGLERVGLVARHPTPWGGFGLVRATLEGVAWLLTRDPAPDHVFLLSGQDYPVKPPEEVSHALAAAGPGGGSSMEWWPVPGNPGWTGQNGGLDRVEFRWVRILGRTRRVGPRRPLPPGLRVYGGSQWWGLSAACLREVLVAVARRDPRVRLLRRALIPDELFFQTLLVESPLGPSIARAQTSYAAWDAEIRHPLVLGRDALPALRATPMPFARKFDLEVDPEVLDRIDAELLGVRG